MDNSTLFFYILFVAGTAWYAHSRGRNPVVWGLVAAFISPLLAVIILAVMKDQQVAKKLDHLDSRTQNLGREMQYHKEFNDYRAQNMQQQLQETRQQQQALQQANRRVSQALPRGGEMQNCRRCGFAVPLGKNLCPNCGEAGTVPQMQQASFQFSLICPLKAHITHIQNLLLQADHGQLIKEIEYLDVQTGGAYGGVQKKLTFVVRCWIPEDQPAGEVQERVRRQLNQTVEQAGYQSDQA